MNRQQNINELFTCIENEQFVNDDSVNVEKIKAKVLSNIRVTRRSAKLSSRRFIAACVATIALLATSVSVFATGTIFGIRLFTVQQKEALKQPQYAYFTENEIETKTPGVFGQSAKIINIEYLEGTTDFIFSNISTIGGTEENGFVKIPAFVFDNGDVALLTKADDTGWNLKKGQSIMVSFVENISNNNNADQDGDIITIGVVNNGVPTYLQTSKALAAQYNFTATEDGEYYFYLQNGSAALIVIENCLIE